MKKLLLSICIIFSLLFVITTTSCDSISDTISDIFEGQIDDEITAEDAASQDFSLRTDFYNIQVAIDDDVDTSDDNVLDAIDEAAQDFFDCQFMEGQNLGLDEFELEDGEMVPAMSELRVYVVPFTFECDAADKSICAGIYFGGEDILVIAEESIGRCGDFPLLPHEISHRYGLNSTHTNIEEFEDCIETEDCGFNDFLDLDIGG